MPEFLGQLLEPVVDQAEPVDGQFAGMGVTLAIHFSRTPAAASWSSAVLIRAERVALNARSTRSASPRSGLSNPSATAKALSVESQPSSSAVAGRFRRASDRSRKMLKSSKASLRRSGL